MLRVADGRGTSEERDRHGQDDPRPSGWSEDPTTEARRNAQMSRKFGLIVIMLIGSLVVAGAPARAGRAGEHQTGE